MEGFEGEFRAVGTKVVVEHSDDVNVISQEGNILPDYDQFDKQGLLVKVYDIGSCVEMELDEEDMVIISSDKGIPAFRWQDNRHFRLVDQSDIYGVFEIGDGVDVVS